MVEIKTEGEGQMEIENFTTELVSGDLDLIHFPSTPWNHCSKTNEDKEVYMLIYWSSDVRMVA